MKRDTKYENMLVINRDGFIQKGASQIEILGDVLLPIA
jgi:hypothetical protein